MITQNQILLHSVYTAVTEANGMKFETPEERDKWEGERTKEIFNNLKAKYGVK